MSQIFRLIVRTETPDWNPVVATATAERRLNLNFWNVLTAPRPVAWLAKQYREARVDPRRARTIRTAPMFQTWKPREEVDDPCPHRVVRALQKITAQDDERSAQDSYHA